MDLPGMDKIKNLGINLIIIIAACIGAFYIYNMQDKKVKELQNTKYNEIKKNEVLADLSKLNKKLTGYKKLLTIQDKSVLVNKIGTIIRDSGAKITSMRPSPDVYSSVYGKYVSDIEITIDSYAALGKLINALENADEVCMVEILEVNPVLDANGEKFKEIKASLQVSAIFYKE